MSAEVLSILAAYRAQQQPRVRQFSASQAKSEFFLSPEDLKGISYESGGWGRGQLRLYDEPDLQRLALAKYGERELEKKRSAKAARLNKKRMREHDAAEAAANLPSADTAPVADKKVVAQTRSFLVKQCKKKVGCEMSGAPNSFRVEVPNISKEVFAALINRPTDVELKSVPKNGAYHSIRMNTAEFLGVTSAEDIYKECGGAFFCLSDTLEAKYKPAGMLLSIHCYSEHSGY